ncbi:MAG: ABC transporter permease [Dongiaceae bacterium]
MRAGLRRVAALTLNEWREVVRAPFAVLVAMGGPAFLLVLFVYGVSLDTERVSVAIVIEQSSPEARDLAGAFYNARYFRPVFFQGRDRAERALADGRVSGVVVLAGDFARAALGEGEAPVQILVDGSDGRTGRTVASYVDGAVARWLAQRVLTRQSPGVPVAQPQTRIWFNPGIDSHYFTAPGMVALIMTVTGALLAALVVGREWERGTMEALLATRARPIELMLAKTICYTGLGVAGTAIALLLTVLIVEVPFRGSVLVLLACATVFMLCALALGFLVSSATRNRASAARLVLTTGYLPTVMLSGLLFDLNNAPAPIQWISHLVAARYFVSILHTLFLAGNVWAIILPNLGAMALIAAGLLLLVARINRRRLG